MADAEQGYGRAYWEERYAAPGLAWSGAPNPVLVTEASNLEPGHALDIGSGEGADAIWLARRGWRVTAIDLAVNALDKARMRANAIDPAAATRIDWQQHDLVSWSPKTLSYDLVSSQFMHLAEPTRSTLFRSLAAAVAPGGCLLIVGHDASPHSDGHHSQMADRLFEVDEVLSAIDGEGLDVMVADLRARTVGAEDSAHTIRDVVVSARRPVSDSRLADTP